MSGSIRSIFWLLIVSLLLAPTMISCGQKQEAVAEVAVPARFTGAERQLVEKLFAEWNKKGVLTSFDQAAAMINLPLTDSLRISVFRKMNDSLMMHASLARHRAWVFTLSNQEKQIAEYVVWHEKKNQEFPTLEQVAAGTGLAPEMITDRLRFLSRLEMFFDLGAPDEYNKLGFSFGQKFNDAMFDLGFRRHEFVVDGGKPFNVGCAKEALFVVASVYPKGRIVYRTDDPLTLEAIEVVFENGDLVSVSPPTARLLEGGTCGTNNLFVNEGAANAYSATLPKFNTNRQFIAYEVGQRLIDVKQQIAEQK